MDDPSQQTTPESESHSCPNCGQAVTPPEPGQTQLQCPSCGQEFFIGADADPEAEQDEAEARAREEEAAQRELDLSEARIRQISNLRRGAFRTRSWLIIAAFTSIAAAAQLVYMAVLAQRRGWRVTAGRDIVLAVACLFLCRYLITRIRRLTREIEQSKIEEPTVPPDFSTLSDGSQRWKNLENMTSDEHHPQDS